MTTTKIKTWQCETYDKLLGLDLALLQPRVGDSLVHVGQSLDEFGALRFGSLDILRRDLAVPNVDADTG